MTALLLLPNGGRRMESVRTRRVYEPAAAQEGTRVLVDRLWPRGLSKLRLGDALWDKEIAPSTDLRKWFGHDPARFEAFAAAYRMELAAKPDAVAALARRARPEGLTLLYAAHDPTCNHAIVLAGVLEDWLRDHPA